MHGEQVHELLHDALGTEPGEARAGRPTSVSRPAIVRLLARDLRPGDVVLPSHDAGDPHELTVVGHPWAAACGQRVHVDVRTRLGVMPKVWGTEDELQVRRGGRSPASATAPPA